MRSHLSCLFDIGQSLFVDFDLRASTRLVFLTLVSHCWWTLTCALPLVLSFSTLVTYYWWTLTCALPLVLSLFSQCWWTLPCALLSSRLFDIGQSQLVDFDLYGPTRLVFFDIGHLLMNFNLCAPTRLVFLTLVVSHCWWTLDCTIPLVLSFSYWSVTVG